jgi:chaperone required for assembly of F1-ATPase
MIFKVIPADGSLGAGWCLQGEKGQLLASPKQKTLVLPTKALAELVAAEWADIKGMPKPGQLQVTGYINSWADHTTGHRDEVLAQYLRYLPTDTLRYHTDATQDAALNAKQQAHWQPVLQWWQQQTSVALPVITTLQVCALHDDDAAKVKQRLAHMDDLRLLCLAELAALYSSAVLAYAVLCEHLSTEQALALSILEETHQIERWGKTEEYEEMANHKAGDIAVIASLLKSLGATD